MTDSLRNFLRDISNELEGHIRDFDTEDVARQLAPRRIVAISARRREKQAQRHCGSHLQREESLIDQPIVENALRNVELPRKPQEWFPSFRRRNIEPLIKFLNNCLTCCYDAYDAIYDAREQLDSAFEISPRNAMELHFIKYDDWARGENIGPIKLEMCCIDDWAGEETAEGDYDCYWAVPIDCEDPQARNIKFAVQMGADWEKHIIPEAGAHARVAFDSVLGRQFVLVIGVNYKDCTLRFLRFHRDGLNQTKDLRMGDIRDRFEIVKLLMSVVLWKTDVDAGILDCGCKDGDGRRHLHMVDGEGDPIVLIPEVELYNNPSMAGKNTRVFRARSKKLVVQSNEGDPSDSSSDAEDSESDEIESSDV